MYTLECLLLFFTQQTITKVKCQQMFPASRDPGNACTDNGRATSPVSATTGFMFFSWFLLFWLYELKEEISNHIEPQKKKLKVYTKSIFPYIFVHLDADARLLSVVI